MNDGVILCNGEFPKKDYPLYLLKSADVIVCCDSALNVRRLEKLGLRPDVIVGDMDSTPEAIQEKYSDRLVRVAEQDDNDLAKAFALMRERFPEVTDIHILGAGGKNEAHTVGNLGWLMEWERRSLEETGLGLAARGIKVEMVSDWSTAFAVSPDHSPSPSAASPCPSSSCHSDASPCHSDASPCHSERSEESLTLHVGTGRKMSFFATDPDLHLRSEGLQWPLDGADLTRWWAATLNRATADAVTLRFSRPAPLLVILD